MPRPSQRRLSADEFKEILPLLQRMKPERVALARLAIVDGYALRLIGEQNGCTRQSVADAVSLVWREVENYRDSQRIAASSGKILPPGWEQATFIAPSYLIERFRKELIRETMPVIRPKSRRQDLAGNESVKMLTE